MFWRLLWSILVVYLVACLATFVLAVAVLHREVTQRIRGWLRRDPPEPGPQYVFDQPHPYVYWRPHSRVTPIAYWDVSAQRALREISTHEDAT